VEVVGLTKLVVVVWFPEIRRVHLGDFHFEKEREGENLKLILNLKERKRFFFFFWREERKACLPITPSYRYIVGLLVACIRLQDKVG
jgi:hypothetical protein